MGVLQIVLFYFLFFKSLMRSLSSFIALGNKKDVT